MRAPCRARDCPLRASEAQLEALAARGADHLRARLGWSLSDSRELQRRELGEPIAATGACSPYEVWRDTARRERTQRFAVSPASARSVTAPR